MNMLPSAILQKWRVIPWQRMVTLLCLISIPPRIIVMRMRYQLYDFDKHIPSNKSTHLPLSVEVCIIFAWHNHRNSIPHHGLWRWYKFNNQLECGTWYHHPRRLQCVLSRNLRILKVATWHYWCRHNLKNNRIWDNLQCCLLVPRSPSKHVMLTFDLQSWKVLFIEIVLWHVKPRKTIMILWHLLTRHCPCNLLPEPTSRKHEHREKLWGHPVTSTMTSSQNKNFFLL